MKVAPIFLLIILAVVVLEAEGKNSYRRTRTFGVKRSSYGRTGGRRTSPSSSSKSGRSRTSRRSSRTPRKGRKARTPRKNRKARTPRKSRRARAPRKGSRRPKSRRRRNSTKRKNRRGAKQPKKSTSGTGAKKPMKITRSRNPQASRKQKKAFKKGKWKKGVASKIGGMAKGLGQQILGSVINTAIGAAFGEMIDQAKCAGGKCDPEQEQQQQEEAGESESLCSAERRKEAKENGEFEASEDCLDLPDDEWMQHIAKTVVYFCKYPKEPVEQNCDEDEV